MQRKYEKISLILDEDLDLHSLIDMINLSFEHSSFSYGLGERSILSKESRFKFIKNSEELLIEFEAVEE